MHRTFALILTIGVVSFAWGQARPSSPRIARLHQEYGQTSDYLRRLVIASNLAHEGDFTHWEFVVDDARRVLRHYRKDDQFYRFPGIRFGPGGKIINPAMATAADTTGTSPSRYEEELTIRAEKQRELDVWCILALASGARAQEKRMLRDAVEIPRSDIAVNAAMGLARLGDVKFVSEILRRAQLAPSHERLMFVEPLVYLKYENVQELADRLAGGDIEYVRELAQQAEANGYDPFRLADEEELIHLAAQP